jgi:hypothetical protein
MILLWNVPEAIVLTESPASGANDGAVPYLITMTTAGYMPDVKYGANVLEAYNPFGLGALTLTGFTIGTYTRPIQQYGLAESVNGTASCILPIAFPSLGVRLSVGISTSQVDSANHTKQLRIVQRDSAGATISTHTQTFAGTTFQEVFLDVTLASTCRSLLLSIDYTYLEGIGAVTVSVHRPMLSLQNRTERVVF